MPISCPLEVLPLSNKEFDVLDRQVLAHAYACQNDLGRLYDESLYENDLTTRLSDAGLRVNAQIPILITHQDFLKRYRVDLMVNESALYDLKTVQAFTPDHEAQILNYVLLLGLSRGKLLNFRGPRVQGRLVATRLTAHDRARMVVDDSRWQSIQPECLNLKKLMLALLADWGGFLQTELYMEALLHLLGGELLVVKNVEIVRDGRFLGKQSIAQHAPNVGFRLTAFTDSLPFHEKHLHRFAKHTSLKGLQWINLNHNEISFITIR
jgi:GxxExxY protein